MNSNCQSVVDLARPPAQRFRSARSEHVFAGDLVVEEVLTEEALIEEVLVRDARAGLTPSDMVERKLIVALNGAPFVLREADVLRW